LFCGARRRVMGAPDGLDAAAVFPELCLRAACSISEELLRGARERGAVSTLPAP
jgi:hypothetical protein